MMENFIASLGIMWKSMLGIFVVMIAITAVVKLLIKITAKNAE